MNSSEVEIQLCAYAYHTRPFRHTFKNGLETYIIRLQREGVCKALIDGKMQPVFPGHLLMFRPKDPYDLSIGEDEETPCPCADYYVMCTGHWVDEWWKRAERKQLTKIANDSKILDLWDQLIQENRRLNRTDQELLTTILRMLLLMIDRAIEESPAFPTATSAIARKVKTYIEENAHSEIKLATVASYVGLSISRVVHIFKTYFGISIIQYTTRVRLNLALELMENSLMTLEQIAEKSGFGSYTYFHKIFKERFGVSPGAYRKR